MKEEPDVLIEAELATASASSQNLRAPSPLGAAADTMDGGTGNLGNPIPEGDRQSAKVAFITDPPAVVVPISESHHEPRAGDGSHSAESGTPVRDDGRDDSMASQFETKNTTADFPGNMPLETQVREKSSRGISQVDRALAEAEHGEDIQDGIADSADSEKPKNTANSSDANIGAPKTDTGRIGFKHDPDEEEVLAGVELDVDISKKKKRPRRSKGKRGANAPTGFEPFYADAPMTPAEFKDNQKIYDPALPITTRLEEAIMRFMYKRLLSPYRRKVFLKFLQYGLIDVGQRHSQGVTPSELKEMTKNEAMEARSVTAIFPENIKGCNVAFNLVTTGYLSGFYMGHYNPETEDEIRECTDTIKNYFTYLLYHNVCPEYNDDLEEARKTCDRAATELWMTQQLVHHDGPGSFNRGCSMLFGGHYFDSVSDLAIWKTVLHADEHIFTIDAARKVVKYAIAITGNDLTAHKFKVLADQDGITAKEIEDIDGFEVISVEEPSADILAYYKELSPDLIPVGKIVAKEFRDPARGLIDLTPAEKIAWDAGLAPTYKFEFLMETTLLPHILPGMKFITTVFETNFGQYFFDETLAVLPTFYTFLYNDWMMDYKAPVPLDFIPDEEEIARRRAKESIMRPVEPTPAEWAMHIMVNQLDLRPLPGEDPLVTAWQIFNCLESFGWDLQELKELIGLVKPQEGKDESTKEDLSTQEDLSSQESQSAKVDKGKQAVRDEQNIEQPIVPTREVCLDVFYEPDPAHRIPPPEVFEAYCKRNLQKLAEKGVFPKQYAEGTEKESLDRVIKSFHTPERIKVTLSPEYKKAFREYRLKRELKSIETQQEHLKDLEFPAQELRQEVVPGSGSQDTLIDEQAIPQIPKVDG